VILPADWPPLCELSERAGGRAGAKVLRRASGDLVALRVPATMGTAVSVAHTNWTCQRLRALAVQKIGRVLRVETLKVR